MHADGGGGCVVPLSTSIALVDTCKVYYLTPEKKTKKAPVPHKSPPCSFLCQRNFSCLCPSLSPLAEGRLRETPRENLCLCVDACWRLELLLLMGHKRL